MFHMYGNSEATPNSLTPARSVQARGCLAAIVLMIGLACDAAQAQPRYRPVVLGAPGGLGADCRAINNSGLAVAWIRDPVGFWSATWQDGGLTPLLPLPGHTETYAEAMDDNGLVVGLSKPWLWEDAIAVTWASDGEPTPLPPPTLLPGGTHAHAISGDRVVGYVAGLNVASIALLWNLTLGTCQPLQFYHDGAPSSEAHGVNAAGVIVGWAAAPNGTPRATLWADGFAEPLNLTPDAVWSSYAFAVNDSGQVAGSCDAQPFLWDGELEFLYAGPNEGGAVWAVNSRGDAVGYLYSYADARYHAMLWADGQAWRLEDCPGVDLSVAVARDISDSGVIACTAYDDLGVLSAVLLHPTITHVTQGAELP